ncbi:MAG: primosomal protein N' [Sediminibacterium sp.]|nr:primosomal protein N' [Sediminibacterium sp.]
MLHIVEVILPLSIPQTLSWSVPPELNPYIKIGIRVEVELGKQKKYSGIVKKIIQAEQSPIQLKSILGVLDENPIVYPYQLKLWEWMAGYYICTEGEIMQAVLPNYLRINSETKILYNADHTLHLENLVGPDATLLALLQDKQELTILEIEEHLKLKSVTKLIQTFVKNGICFLEDHLKDKYKLKIKNFYQLNPEYNLFQLKEFVTNTIKNKDKKNEILNVVDKLAEMGQTFNDEILKSNVGLSYNQIQYLLKKDILIKNKQIINRISIEGETNHQQTIKLSDAQHKAFEEINQHLEKKGACLVHGITGSGKTEIFIAQIDDKIKSGGQALYLLPEIALTVQTKGRLEKYFGLNVAVFHSRCSQEEKTELWYRVLSGEIKIVLGSRSALFLPFNNLKIIVVDEEHDYSYKQTETNPRYHARDTSLYVGFLNKIPVILGTATPSFESYHNALQNKIGLVQLLQRFGNATLPQINYIDLRSSTFIKGNKFLSENLVEKISLTLKEDKQVIVFHNRRGYDPYWLCQVCGTSPMCNFCHVNLCYHKVKNCLKCHYCNTVYPIINACQKCGSFKFAMHLLGTEKLTENLQEIFSSYVVKRMDFDTTRGKYSFNELINEFEDQKIHILVGTQMIVKGLDFKNVSLVVVVDADSIINHIDFRMNERAFQLLEQVCGRAGRFSTRGEFYVQTRNPEHPVLQILTEHNYDKLFNFEIDVRKNFNYPPFYRVMKIIAKDKQPENIELFLNEFLPFLSKIAAISFNNPSEPQIFKIKNLFIRELFIKLPKEHFNAGAFKQDLKRFAMELKKQSLYKSIKIYYDVDWI